MSIQKIATVAAVLGSVVIGFLLGDYRGEIRLQDAQLQAAAQRADDGRKSYERLVEAQNALDAARRDAVDLRDMSVRVRDAYEDRLRRAEKSADKPCRADCSECERLLSRSAELLGRGGTLLQDAAARHDAVVKAVHP